jgi:hypothetical protein
MNQTGSMIPFAVTIIIQIALVVHVLRTGRAIWWIFIIFFLPAIGSIAYVVVELLPEWSNSFHGRKAMKGVRKTLSPGAELRQRERLHSMSGSVDAARHLARELIESGRFAEAVELYENALTGLYEHDPDLLLGLAEAQFGKGEFEQARHTLERLTEHNPDYRSPTGHLLYARTLQEVGELDPAEKEYEAVSAYFPGAEAKVRYATLLEQLGKGKEAKTVYEDVVASAEIGPRHYRKVQKRWIREAKEALKRLQSG